MKRFPESRCTIKRNQLNWIGDLKPSPLSQEYTIRLTYKLDDSPDVNVLNPELEKRDGKRPPHLYPKERLCLYLPGMNEWNGEMLLAETIVPWTSEWLLHYEIWLATGEWCGGGEHPDVDLDDGKPDTDLSTRSRGRSNRRWDRGHRPK